jgi:bifunctional oligoribonuclease and PAP phosphatase NrnA
MNQKNQFEELLNTLKEKNNFIITTHTSCDPDGIGSELALSYLLEKLGKYYIILNPDKTPERYQFIDVQNKLSHYEPDKFININSNPTVIVVDNSELKRINDINLYINSDQSNVIIIDHHDGIEKAKGLFCYPEIGSTSEIIYELIELENIDLDYNTALAIYSGIIMDTGQFKYNKTRPRTHEIASKLLKHKLQTEEIIRKLFENTSTNVLLLKRDIYNTLEIYHNNSFASIEITREMLNKYNFKTNPAEGITSELLSATEIVVSVAFVEIDPETTKISLRSKGKVDIRQIAEKYSGGGHKNASGATIKGSFQTVKNEIIDHIKNLIINPK